MARTTYLAAAATAMTLLLGAVAPLQAQDAAPAPGSGEAIPDELITSFVVAVLQVGEIADEFQPRLEAAEDEVARAAIQEEAQQEMILAVQATDGITVEEYMAISQAARVDEDLNNRVMQTFQDLAPTE